MEIKKLWDIILRRKWIIFQAFVLIFAVVIIGTLLKKPTYLAEDYLVIEQHGTQEALLRSIGLEQVSEILFSMNLGQKSSIVYIEMMKIMTKPILDEVVKRMDLRGPGDELIPGPKLKLPSRTFSWFPLKGVAVKPHKLANILVIQGYSPNPQEALDLCNTLAQVYIESDIASKHKETADAARFAEEQSMRAKADWNEAKKRLKEYQEAEGLVDFSSEAQILINNIAKLRADQDLLELSRNEISKYGDAIPDPFKIGGDYLSRAGQIGQLKTSLAQLESELESKLTRYTQNHPSVVAHKQQITELKQKLLQEKQVFEESNSAKNIALQDQINNLNLKMASFPEKLYTMAQLSLQSNTYERLYEMLLDMKYRLNITEAMQISKLSLIEPAWKPRVHSPILEENLIIAFILSIIIGFGLAFLIEYLDDTIKDGDMLQTEFNLPLLGTVPMVPKKDDRILLPVEDDNHSRIKHILNESFNVFSYNIKLGSLDSRTRHVMITSSAPEEGKTSVCANLGINMALKGSKVVIVDSDFPRSAINRVFGVSNELGLTNVILGENKIDEVVQETGIEGLNLITTGPKPPSSILLYESSQFRHFLQDLEERYDFIIFDTPPVLSLNDPVVLSSYLDRTILVVASQEVSRQAIRHGVNTLRKGKSHLMGAVLNKFHTDDRKHYYYYYYSYYSPDGGNGFRKFLHNMGFRKKKRRHRSSRKDSLKV